MAKILAFDPGTNSLGMVLRDTSKENLIDQITAGVDIVRDNNVKESTGRYHSAAAERRTFRTTRTRYLSVKRRKQATLKLLIRMGYCPLDMESLNKWRFDIDEKGYDRSFPIHDTAFMDWIRIHINVQAIGEEESELVTSPYRLREILVTKKLDFTLQENKYLLGRAIYHIAVRRGFKSSRNAIQVEEDGIQSEQESEEKIAKGLRGYMLEHQCKTAGAAFSRMEREDGIRIRANVDYRPIRSLLKDEIEEIFEFQGLDTTGEFYRRLMSEVKHEGTIFYKNPLKSQKGKIEHCTLEPSKKRCPKSHPANEFNVAWQLLNTIKIRKDGVWSFLSLEDRQAIYDKLFIGRAKKHFDFIDIKKWIQLKYNVVLEQKTDINYRDDKNVPGCPVSHYLKKILGDGWENAVITSDKCRLSNSQQRKKCNIEELGHTVSYSAEDLWHICYDSDEKAFVIDFASKTLALPDDLTAHMGHIWESIQEGYSNLSLKAIRKINAMLKEGYIYSDAVMLANLPTILLDKQIPYEKAKITSLLDNVKSRVTDTNTRYDIANRLISDYKSLVLDGHAFAEHNYDYTLQEDDVEAVSMACQKHFGKQWESMADDVREKIITHVGQLYQEFFYSHNRDYFRRLNMTDELKNEIHDKYPTLRIQELNKLYHHSDSSYYPAAELNENGIPQLGSPERGMMRNPSVMKILYRIKNNVNKMLLRGDIDPDTIIIVENARELNDYNMQWALEEYNKKRESEHKAIEKALVELSKSMHFTYSFNDETIEKARYALYQNTNFTPYSESKGIFYDKLVEKYKLWLQQGFLDFYTGRFISLSELFSQDNIVEVDHILPLSKSFDNSLSNKVLTSSNYNASIKRLKLPYQLPNYLEDTPEGTAIINRINEIKRKVLYLEDKVNYWKKRSSHAGDLESKNKAIKQMHLWRLEYEEWKHRLDCLTATEIKEGFRSSQLNDTRIISKYAFHYLKSLFGRVVMQRGETTAAFRKIFGLQSLYDTKDRSRNTHHALDALTLSLIPYGPKRERMLELFYQKLEARRFHNKIEERNISSRLEREIASCGLGDFDIEEIREYIETTTLVVNDNTIRAIQPTYKRQRRGGKIILARDKNGHVIMERNASGNLVPKAKHISRGASLRGGIHDQTIYGKVKLWRYKKKECNGKSAYCIEVENNTKLYDEVFISRKDLKFAASEFESGFKSWDDLEESIVDKKFFEFLRKQFEPGIDFKEACSTGFYQTKTVNGKELKYRIRAVKCIVSNKQPLKKHIYCSSCEEKQTSYVKPSCAYCICEFVVANNEGKSVKPEYVGYNLYTISQRMKNGEEPIPNQIYTKGRTYNLRRKVTSKDTILILKADETINDILQLPSNTISNRLYRVTSIEEKAKKLYLTRHNLAKTVRRLNAINDSMFDNLPDGIRQSIGSLKFLIMGTDFDIINGKIVKI